MLLLLLEWCSGQDQLTSYKRLKDNLNNARKPAFLIHWARMLRIDGKDDSDDDTHSRNYGGLGPNFKNRLD